MTNQRVSISFGLIVLGSACEPIESDRPTVNYISVEARPSKAHVRGTSLSVEIEVEATSSMSNVAPHVIVAARCGSQTDQAQAFFMTLSRAQPGDRKVDTVELFGIGAFETAPERCELTLTLSKGATQPQRYCYEQGATHAGRCS